MLFKLFCSNLLTWILTHESFRSCKARFLSVRITKVLDISRLESDVLTRELREFHNQKHHYFHTSSNIIEVVKYVRLRWTGHVSSMEGKKCLYNFCWKTSGEKHLWYQNNHRCFWNSKVQCSMHTISTVDSVLNQFISLHNLTPQF